MVITKTTTVIELLEGGAITTRTYNCLNRYWKYRAPNIWRSGRKIPMEITTVADILEISYDDLFEIRNMGVKSLNAMCEALYENGLEVRGYVKAIKKEKTKPRPKPLTPEQFKEKMLKLKERYDKDHDEETFHSDADDLMWDILKKLGYNEGVDIYNSVHKYYS